MAIVLSLIIAKPSGLSNAADQPLANMSMNNFFFTGLIALPANPVESTNASTVFPPYKPEVTAVAPLMLMVKIFFLSPVPLKACSIIRNVLSLIAAISPIFQSLNLIWFEPLAPIIPSFK